MDLCWSCRKPIDYSKGEEKLKYTKSLGGGPRRTLTVQCRQCGAWNSKDIGDKK
jgi:hypothetical protein